MSSTAIPKVVPAHLSFLAIYNPALGTSDETFHNQIVFYYSKAARARSRIHGADAQAERELKEQENEKLRQVGLAQGMVGFARSFSDDAAVDSVETQKSRIVLHELERGWWILASIDLTQLPAHTQPGTGNGDTNSQPAVEYSSREVSPPALLIQQLVRAHNIFLLHHGMSLGGMFEKHNRTKFCNILEKYWSRFSNNWDVLLHGSPAVDIYNGMKLAAGGELGMGVGEEEWGSGERLVLEDFVQKTEGLVDLIVSRFGEPSSSQDLKRSADANEHSDLTDLEPWIGSGRTPGAADGIVFSGVGAITRRSLRDTSQWIETIYSHGDYAYGVRDNPTTDRKRRRRKEPPTSPSPDPAPRTARRKDASNGQISTANVAPPSAPMIPPDIARRVETSLDKASSAVESSHGNATNKQEPLLASLGDTETWMKYLTLGYGTAWGSRKAASDEPAAPQKPATEDPSPAAPMRYVDPEPDIDHAAERLKAQIRQENAGYFVIGLKGDMDEGEGDDSNEDGDWNNRTLLRTVHVQPTDESTPETPGTGDDDSPQFEKNFNLRNVTTSKLRRLRPVVYVHRPFIYTFLFRHRTESLTMASFYRNLHTFFSPLHRPLSLSTSPDKIMARIFNSSAPYTTTSSHKGAAPNTQPIYDLVYDPRTLTVHSSLPNIPDPGTLTAEGLGSGRGWSRVEALNVHAQILATVGSTRRTRAEIERTCKTGRGWWVVWMRLRPSEEADDDVPSSSRPSTASTPTLHAPSSDPRNQNGNENGDENENENESFPTGLLREAFLVRKARDAEAASSKSGSGAFGIWGERDRTGGKAAGWGPRGLAEGIGIDARRYVEGLLSLNR